MTIHWKVVEQYFIVDFFNFSHFVSLENLPVLNLALSEVKRLKCRKKPFVYILVRIRQRIVQDSLLCQTGMG